MAPTSCCDGKLDAHEALKITGDGCRPAHLAYENARDLFVVVAYLDYNVKVEISDSLALDRRQY